MSSSLRVNTIVPSTGTNVAIGTANGTVTFIDSVNFVLGTGSSIFSPASNTLTFGTNDAERLRITSDGKIGIGTDNPTETLTLNHANGASIGLEYAGSEHGTLSVNSAAMYARAGSGKHLILGGNATESLRLKSDGKSYFTGNVGINETSPSHVLDVKSQAAGTYFINGQNHNGNNIFQVYESSDGDGNHGMLYLNNGSGTTLTKISTNGSSYFNGGNIGINITTPERKLEVVDTNSNGSYPLAVSNFINATANRGAAIDFRLTTSGNTRGEIGCTWTSNSSSDGTCFYFAPNDGSTGNIERLRLTGDGKFGFNTTNPGAFDSGANHLVLLGNTSGTGNAGITIASGTDSYGNIYFADGTSGADAYRGHIAYNHNGNTMRFATNGSEKVRILSSGFVNIGSGYLTNSNSGLHVGRSSGGTAAGESVIAATLGDSSSMVNALLSVKNAGNRGAQGQSGGSSLAKFEFNNGTALEVDKYGRLTTPYQPAFKCKLSGATGANFTGYFVFGNVSYNIGSHYNSSNGRFTAPIDGRYLFAWYTNMERAGGNGSFYAEWYINGNAQGNRMYTHHSGAWELIGGTVIFDLNANDYVQIQAITSGNWDGGSYGSYSGCLLG